METIDAIRSRRAINFFDSSREVPQEKLLEIIELAGLAPSSGNLQPWEVVLVTDLERKRALRRCASNQAKVEEASAVLIILANPGAVEENLEAVTADRISKGYVKAEAAEKQKEYFFGAYGGRDSEPRRIFAVKNAAFFAMNFMIAAAGLGYATHPMDGFDPVEVKREFGIPDNRVIPLLIAVGHPAPDMTLLPRPGRRGVDEYIMMNGFRDSRGSP
ncbi:MAG: nitroreductase family protein [Spirochaetes bacterium]|nr:nitroreductase family protein [Spirochaetota bacterium]